MKKLNLAAMLLGATLFIGFGATSLSAGDKCGAGKCGDSKMEKPAKKGGMGKCGDAKKEKASKCGDAKKEKKKAMKCGTGKCGSK
ncbi:hypothetical protein [Sulfurimonas sp.]